MQMMAWRGLGDGTGSCALQLRAGSKKREAKSKKKGGMQRSRDP